jgi:hypothetical protein
VAELAARWAEPLASLPAGARVGFPGAVYPEAIPLDLAVLGAGLTAAPLAAGALTAGAPGAGGSRPPAEALEALGCDAWLDLAAGEARVTTPGGSAPSWEPGGRAGAAAAPRAPGGAGVLVKGEAGGWRRVPQRDLTDAAVGVAAAIEPSDRREILVLGQPLGEPAARLLTAWAILAGAALVLDPDPQSRLGTVLWSRPTVIYGSATELAMLRRSVAAASRAGLLGRAAARWRPGRGTAAARPRARRLPLGRLRTLFQDGPPEPADAAFWQEHGARLLQLPQLT